MKGDSLHDNLLKALRDIIPSNSQLANRLIDTLYIGKEAVYRRLRGEVHFSLEEASVISEKLGISLDGIMGTISNRRRPFTFKMAKFSNPDETDYQLINEFVEFLEFIKDNPDTQMGTAAKMIPDALHLQYKHITQFHLFKWLYQYDNLNTIKKFENVKGTDRLLRILENMKNLLSHIKSSYYIFDKMVFQNIVDDIKYFEKIGLVSAEDIKLLKEDLFICLDNLENLAAKGVNEAGNKTDIYISNITFEAGFSYIQSDKYNLSSIRAFTMYDISSVDEIIFDNSLKWMNSLKRASTLISESGEIPRMSFLKTQREIVSSL